MDDGGRLSEFVKYYLFSTSQLDQLNVNICTLYISNLGIELKASPSHFHLENTIRLWY